MIFDIDRLEHAGAVGPVGLRRVFFWRGIGHHAPTPDRLIDCPLEDVHVLKRSRVSPKRAPGSNGKSRPTPLNGKSTQWTPRQWAEAAPIKGVAALTGLAICCTPRSGSTWLSDLLRSTGVLGHPHEYLSTYTMRQWVDVDYPDSIALKVEQIKRRAVTANGVYSFKLFPHQLAAIGQCDWLSDLPALRFVHLRRADVLGQALSLVIAGQTGRYFAAASAVGSPEYDRQAIEDAIDTLLAQEALLQRFFATSGIVPLVIDYDELIADPQRSVNRIAQLLGMEAAPINHAAIGVERQSESEKNQWRSRFLEEQGQGRALIAPRSLWQIRWQRRWRRIWPFTSSGQR